MYKENVVDIYPHWNISLKKEVLAHATVCTMWMSLGDVQSEISQSQRNKYCVTPPVWSTYSNHSEMERRTIAAWARGVSVHSVQSFSFARREGLCGWMIVMAACQCKCLVYFTTIKKKIPLRKGKEATD